MFPLLHTQDTQPVYLVEAQLLLLHLNPAFQTFGEKYSPGKTISFYFSGKDFVQETEITVGNLLVFRNIFMFTCKQKSTLQAVLPLKAHCRGIRLLFQTHDDAHLTGTLGDTLSSWLQQPRPQHIIAEVKGVDRGGVRRER